MKILDIVLLGILAIWLLAVIRYCGRQHRNGGCVGCSGCGKGNCEKKNCLK